MLRRPGLPCLPWKTAADYFMMAFVWVCLQDYNDEIRQEQMREMQLLNTTVLGVPGTSADIVTPTSSAQSPTTSPPPTSANKTTNNGSANSGQNGRHVQMAVPYSQQNGRNYLCNQQFLLHPAFRGLTARAHGLQLPGVATGKFFLLLFLHFRRKTK